MECFEPQEIYGDEDVCYFVYFEIDAYPKPRSANYYANKWDILQQGNLSSHASGPSRTWAHQWEPKQDECYEDCWLDEQKSVKRESTADDKTVEDYKKMGASAFKAGEKRRPPHPGDGKWKIGSLQSKDSNNKMKAWLNGWDKANLEDDGWDQEITIDGQPAKSKKDLDKIDSSLKF